jgi:hypothetical protein
MADRLDKRLLTPEGESALVWLERSADDLRERRLAGPVVTYQGQDLSRPDLEARSSEGLDMTESLHDPGGLEHVRCGEIDAAVRGSGGHSRLAGRCRRHHRARRPAIACASLPAARMLHASLRLRPM